MVSPTQLSTPSPPVVRERRVLRLQSQFVALVVVAVLCVDQATKAWGWRHVDDAFLDTGGGPAVSSGIATWFEHPVYGAALDLADAIALAGLFLLLGRRRRPVPFVVSASLVLGGFGSNLGDRLGLHFLTAPGSVRGVVDFVTFAGLSWNVADFCIVVGLVRLPASVAVTRWLRPAAASTAPVLRPLASRRTRYVLAGAFLVAVGLAVFGACRSGGVLVPMG